jgi:ABC-type Co2+ transport system permease subunit
MVMIPLSMEQINAAVADFFAIPLVAPALALIIGLGLASFLFGVVRSLFEHD